MKYLWAIIVFATGCGPVTPAQTIVETSSTDEEVTTASQLEELVLEHELAAANILNEALTNPDRTLAAWAAVYSSRLNIKHDTLSAFEALSEGTRASDPLLAALCWRRLATVQNTKPLPKWKNHDEPTVAAMAAVAYAVRGAIPKKLESALGIPEAEPKPDGDKRAETKALVEQLLGASRFYDNGPLALAIAFVETRRWEWTEKDESGKTSWVASRLRNELVSVISSKDSVLERISKSTDKKGYEFGRLSQLLDNSLVKQPPKKMRTMALMGQPNLRRTALKAIATNLQPAQAGDFGAAAAALKADDPLVRVDGAGVYLFLCAGAHQD